MSITKNTLPSITPEFALPLDTALQFANAQTLTASGYVNNVAAQLNIGGGRFVGALALDVSALAFGSSDEFYQFYLMGSNDVNWANGNVELLGAFDFANASAHRMVTTILGASPTVPPAGRAGALRTFFFSNMTYGGYVFQYLQLYMVTGGTSPSATVSAWVVPIQEVC